MQRARNVGVILAAFSIEQIDRGVVEADNDGAHELVDVRCTCGALLHDAEHQRFDRPVVEADLPGVVRARRAVVRFAVAELEVETLGAALAVDQRHQQLHEDVVGPVAAVDRQQVAAGAAEAARRSQLQALVGDELCRLVAVLDAEAERQRRGRGPELCLRERARHERLADQLVIVLLLQCRRGRVGRHRRRDAVEAAEHVDRHAGRIAVGAGDAVRRLQRVLDVREVAVALSQQHTVRLAVLQRHVVVPVLRDAAA
jgi:hypothetical protein